MPTVEAIRVKLRSGLPLKERERVRLIGDLGIEGDANARPGSKRQVLIISAEALDALGLQPGDARENIVTRGIDLDDLPRGTVIRVGSARLELTFACAPCKHLDDVRSGLSAEIRGQRGMLFRVLDGGEIAVGDDVAVVT